MRVKNEFCERSELTSDIDVKCTLLFLRKLISIFTSKIIIWLKFDLSVSKRTIPSIVNSFSQFVLFRSVLCSLNGVNSNTAGPVGYMQLSVFDSLNLKFNFLIINNPSNLAI